MATYAQVMHDRRNEAIGTLRHLLDSAAGESRDLNPEELEQADRIEADIKRFSDEAQRALRMEQLQRETDQVRGESPRIEGSASVAVTPAPGSMLQAMFQRFRAGERDQVFDLSADTGVMLRGFDARPLDVHLRAMAKVYDMDIRELEQRMAGERGFETRSFEARAMQSAGGSAIPTDFLTSVIEYQRTATPMLDGNIVTLLETTDGRPITLPRLTADPNHGGTVTAEAGGINELDPTISSITLNAFKYGVTNLWSAELGQDNVINLESLLARSTGRELGLDIGAHLTTGTGTTQPKGIVDAATAGYTATGTASGTSSDTFFSPADVKNLWYSLAAPYRNAPGAGFMVSSTALTKFALFRDTTFNFIWQPSLVAGDPDRFLGRPVYENPGMAAVASATKSVIAGDFSAYYVRRTPIRVETSRDYKFNTDQLALRTIYRVDGNLPDAIAIKSLVSANT